MRAAAAHADALGASSPMLRATVARLERLVAERDGPPAP
jgi:hypothetical protein